MLLQLVDNLTITMILSPRNNRKVFKEMIKYDLIHGQNLIGLKLLSTVDELVEAN